MRAIRWFVVGGLLVICADVCADQSQEEESGASLVAQLTSLAALERRTNATLNAAGLTIAVAGLIAGLNFLQSNASQDDVRRRTEQAVEKVEWDFKQRLDRSVKELKELKQNAQRTLEAQLERYEKEAQERIENAARIARIELQAGLSSDLQFTADLDHLSASNPELAGYAAEIILTSPKSFARSAQLKSAEIVLRQPDVFRDEGIVEQARKLLEKS